MLKVGYRIRLSSRSGPDREGVITAMTGSVLRVRWRTEEETSIVPAPGTLTVLTPTPRMVPSPQAVAQRGAAKTSSAAKSAATTKSAATKKSAARKTAARKGGSNTTTSPRRSSR